MIDSAIILAGGRGSRLMPWPAPKCLLPVNGVPILSRLIGHLEAFEIKKIVVCTGYRTEDIKSYIQRTSVQPPLLSNAGEDAPMGERIIKAKKDHGLSGHTLICYGDEMADVDLRSLVKEHADSRSKATCTAYRHTLPFGVVRDGQIRSGETVLVNIGFVLVEEDGFQLLDREDGLSDWMNRLAAVYALNFYIHNGKRVTVNDIAELIRAEEVWS